MTTHLRTLSDLLSRTRWGLVVLAAAWIVLATGLELVAMTVGGYTCSAGACTADARLAAGATGRGRPSSSMAT